LVGAPPTADDFELKIKPRLEEIVTQYDPTVILIFTFLSSGHGRSFVITRGTKQPEEKPKA